MERSKSFRFQAIKRWLSGLWPRLQYGIENLIAYAPIIWRDRDWDHADLTRLLEFKLRRMAAHFEKYGHHLSSERDAKQIREAAILCKRMALEDYEPERFQLAKDYKRIDTMHRQDLERLCLLLKKYLRNWWD
jgi:hypothetical protein